MKVLVDTNIFVASMRFAGLKRKLVWKLLEEGEVIVLTDFILEELRRKFSELYTPVEVKRFEDYAQHLPEAEQLIQAKDAPILAAAMLSDIDILLTRDKQDFLENARLQQTRWMAKIKSPQELLSLLEEDEG